MRKRTHRHGPWKDEARYGPGRKGPGKSLRETRAALEGPEELKSHPAGVQSPDSPPVEPDCDGES